MVHQAGLGAPGLLVDRPGPLRGLQDSSPGPGSHIFLLFSVYQYL